MAFSSVLGASSVIRPGVCTSTTRPTVPYEGQLIYETDTDRVASYNGSAWVYGSFTGGFILLKAETSFSAVSSVTCDSVFTSAYRNYKVFFNYTTSTTSGPRLRLRTGGSSTSTTTYNEQYVLGAAEVSSASRGASAASIGIGLNTNGSYNSSLEITIYNPQVVTPTTVHSVMVNATAAYTAPQVGVFGGNQSGSTSFDGFEIFPSSGTLTGNYVVYGLAIS